MTLTMYAATVPVFQRLLNNMLRQFDKAEAYAAERKFDVDVLVSSRLAPDMHPLSFQVQSATDRTKFVLARLTGREAPSWPDTEKTFAELRGRIQTALDYVATFSEADLAGTDTKEIPLKIGGKDATRQGMVYLLHNGYPNLYFHLTTAYDILRHNGVPVGKGDFTGPY